VALPLVDAKRFLPIGGPSYLRAAHDRSRRHPAQEIAPLHSFQTLDLSMNLSSDWLFFRRLLFRGWLQWIGERNGD